MKKHLLVCHWPNKDGEYPLLEIRLHADDLKAYVDNYWQGGPISKPRNFSKTLYEVIKERPYPDMDVLIEGSISKGNQHYVSWKHFCGFVWEAPTASAPEEQ